MPSSRAAWMRRWVAKRHSSRLGLKLNVAVAGTLVLYDVAKRHSSRLGLKQHNQHLAVLRLLVAKRHSSRLGLKPCKNAGFNEPGGGRKEALIPPGIETCCQPHRYRPNSHVAKRHSSRLGLKHTIDNGSNADDPASQRGTHPAWD